MNSQVNYRVLALACLIISIGQLSMGLVFPSLPWIAKDFDITLDQAQLLVSVYLFGFGPSQFIYGPVSDSLGRKKVLLFGLFIALAGLVSITLFHDSFEALVLGRLLQGIGTGCCAVLARATIRDSHSGDQLAKALGYISHGGFRNASLCSSYRWIHQPSLWLADGVCFATWLCRNCLVFAVWVVR